MIASNSKPVPRSASALFTWTTWSIATRNAAKAVVTNRASFTRLTGTPTRRGYYLGNFPALERDRPELEASRRVVRERLAENARVARDVGAPLVVLFVPAPGQVCSPADLPYWPRGVDLAAVARACHAHGETVDDRGELVPALLRGLKALEAGQPAVIDVRIAPN